MVRYGEGHVKGMCGFLEGGIDAVESEEAPFDHKAKIQFETLREEFGLVTRDSQQ